MYWFRRAGRWTRTEPDKGANSAYYVGKNYAEGIGIEKDEQEAVKWFRIAAKGGHKEAAETLGKAYAEGLYGLPRDPDQSQHWLRKAQ
jgi:TPR repeat protein